MTWKGFFIVSLSILLSFVLFFFLVGTSMSVFLFPASYRQAFDAAGVHDMIENQFQTSAEGMNPSFLSLSPEGIREIIDEALVKTLAYVRGSSDTLEIKVAVNTSAIRSVFLDGVTSLPICDLRETSFDDEKLRCRPENQSSDVLLDEYLARTNKTMFLTSGEVDIVDVFDPQHNRVKLRERVNYYYIALGVLFILGLLLIISVLVLAHLERGQGIYWIGISFFCAGILAFLLLLAGSSLVDALPLHEQLPQVRLGVTVLFHAFFVVLAWSGCVVAVLGVCFFFVSRRLRSRLVS